MEASLGEATAASSPRVEQADTGDSQQKAPKEDLQRKPGGDTEHYDGKAGQDYCLPAETPNLLCNWSPLSEPKLSLVLEVCKEVWGASGCKNSLFCDLGCGDGRVVAQVCQTFSECHGLGMDLNGDLVDIAKDSAKKGGYEDRCEFKVGDLADIDLSKVTFVFLNLPPPALSQLMKRIFPKSGLRPGAIILSAGGPLSGSKSIEQLCLKRTCMEANGIYGYLWRGKETKEPAARTESLLGNVLSSQISRFSTPPRQHAKGATAAPKSEASKKPATATRAASVDARGATNRDETNKVALTVTTVEPCKGKRDEARAYPGPGASRREPVASRQESARGSKAGSVSSDPALTKREKPPLPLPCPNDPAAHEAAVQRLREVYKHVDTGFGNDQTDSHLDSGNLQYGEVTYEGMEALYSAIELGPEDVFYDLGSGVAKLVLYVALRGHVAGSVGVEIGRKRHCLAEKAVDLLTKDLEERRAEAVPSNATSSPCSKFSVVLGDVRKNCFFKDVTVVGCSNVCMDSGVQNRMIDSLMKCTSFRRIASIAPLPPNRRLKLVRTVSAACTWARIASWHVYDVLAARAPRASSLSTAGPPVVSKGSSRVRSSASLPALARGQSAGVEGTKTPPELNASGTSTSSTGYRKPRVPLLPTSHDAAAKGSGRSRGRPPVSADARPGVGEDSRAQSTDEDTSRAVEGSSKPSKDWHERAAIKLRCITPNGARYRSSPKLADFVAEAQPGQEDEHFVQYGAVLNATERRGEWVKTPSGWLPLQIEGKRKFERLPHSARPVVSLGLAPA